MKIIIAVLAIIAVISGGTLALNNFSEPNKSQETGDTDNSAQTSETDNNNEQQPNSVTIKDYAFGPQKLTVAAGTKVTWTNQDSAGHDITPDNPGADFMGSNLLSKGESYSFMFDKPGLYTYYCSPHPYMKATIEVI